MNIAFYTARTGLIAQQEGLNIYSNNIANVNTVGFKASRPSFADCIYTIQRATEPEWQTGHGEHVQKTDLMYSEGTFVYTDRELDFAIPHAEGFFAVQDKYGDVNYTRAGDFQISQIDDHWELVSANGEFVLDYEGNHITVPFIEGTTTPDYATLTDMIGVYAFDNNFGLELLGSNKFTATERSGEAVADPTLDKIWQALERSNTDIAGDMVHIIETQRSYQLSAKIVQTADELERISNNLR